MSELKFENGGEVAAIVHIDGDQHSRALVLQNIVLDERQINEIRHCMHYALHLHHGADGHNRMMLVYQMACALGIRYNADGNLTIPEYYIGTVYHPAHVRTYVADNVRID